MRKARAHYSKLPRQTRTVQEKATEKRTMSIENDNSTDEKDKAERMIAAISTKALAKSNGTEYGQTNIDRRNNSAEDRIPTRSKNTDRAEGKRIAPVQE